MGNNLLKLGGVLSFAVALLHLVIIFIGGPAYRYFGAGEEMAQLTESGSLRPALITLGITVVFILFGLYAFSGAKLIRRLPLLNIALPIISVIYTLRGMAVVPEIIYKINAPDAVPARMIIFSAAALSIGLLYLSGTIKNWKNLRAPHNYTRL